MNRSELEPIIWKEHQLVLLDQRVLPGAVEYRVLATADEVADAIRNMVVRGAPAIGIAAAYGVVLSCIHRSGNVEAIKKDMQTLASSRPTAVNLHHALGRLDKVIQAIEQETELQDAASLAATLLGHAQDIQAQDLAFNLAMAQHGMKVLQASKNRAVNVLTHCNTGALATGGLGTALGIIKQSSKAGIIHQIYASETRPWLQGSRLTVFELRFEKHPVTLLVEGAAASLMSQGCVDWLIVGADRIARNGDTANKIGTYTLALIAKQFGVKVMVAAPYTTVDIHLLKGDDIPIEFREGTEILKTAGYTTEDIDVYNPAFDVTPAALIDVIVTESGAFAPHDLAEAVTLMEQSRFGCVPRTEVKR